MGYRDDFYIVDNIIGHTGKAHSDPTVYFQNGDDYGRITQNHDIKENIGREVVRNDPKYTLGNEKVNGKEVCRERVGPLEKDVKHTSRTKIVWVEDMRDLDKKLLAQSIYNFTSEKKLSNLQGKDAVLTTYYGETAVELGKLGRGGLKKYY